MVPSQALGRHPSADLTRPESKLAVDKDMSEYDAFYAVLSDPLEPPLVTADRELAAALEGCGTRGRTRDILTA